MKVNPLNESALTSAASGTSVQHHHHAGKSERGQAAGTATAQDAATTGTPVTVSAAAQSLSASAVGSGSGIDETKVAAMKAAIANGSFKVDSGAIADKLLSNAQEFLSRAGG